MNRCALWADLFGQAGGGLRSLHAVPASDQRSNRRRSERHPDLPGLR